jgi:hypothetical protein
MIYDTEILNDLLGVRLVKYRVSNITAETNVLWRVNLLSRDYVERPVKFTKRYAGQPFVCRDPNNFHP